MGKNQFIVIALKMNMLFHTCARSLTDKAPASGAVDWRFESSRAHWIFPLL